MALATRS